MRSEYFADILYYSRGNIAVKNPDGRILRKMLEIAGRLNAKLQGDEGEVYDLAEINKVSAALDNLNARTRVSKPWWKFW